MSAQHDSDTLLAAPGVSELLQRNFDFFQNGRVVNGGGHLVGLCVGDSAQGTAQYFA